MSSAMTESEFQSLFDEHFADLWRFVRRRVSATSDADDVVAETFSVAWRRRGDVPDGSAARLWLFATARNVLLNHRRSGARQERVRLRLVGEPAPGVRVEPDQSSVRDVLARLPEDDLDLVRMRYWDQLAIHEIAELVGITANAVSIRLHRIRAVLREELQQEESRDVV